MFKEESHDIVVTPKIDLIKVTIDKQENSNELLNNFFNKINSITLYKTTPLKQNKTSYNHSRIYTISINAKQYSLIVSESIGEPYKPFLLTLHDPDKGAVTQLEEYLKLLNQYNLNAVEFVLDFGHVNNDIMYHFLISTVALAWRGKTLDLEYDTTKYLNNNYTAWSKAGKIYRKEVIDDEGNAKEVSRIEITFKNHFLIKKEIRKCNDLFKVKLNDVVKYISFKEFNYNLFTNKLLELGKTKQQIEQIFIHFRSDINKGLIQDVNEQAKLYYYNKNYLKDHRFNRYFKNLLPNKNFWDSCSFVLNSGMME